MASAAANWPNKHPRRHPQANLDRGEFQTCSPRPSTQPLPLGGTRPLPSTKAVGATRAQGKHCESKRSSREYKLVAHAHTHTEPGKGHPRHPERRPVTRNYDTSSRPQSPAKARKRPDMRKRIHLAPKANKPTFQHEPADINSLPSRPCQLQSVAVRTRLVAGSMASPLLLFCCFPVATRLRAPLV